MPVNKNAMTRYQILDGLLSDRYHAYSINDLLIELNKQLNALGLDAIGRRMLEKDIHYIEYEGPFLAEIERYYASGFDREKMESIRKQCLRYADPSYSIFKKELTDDEAFLLSEALSMLGQFDGLPNLQALEKLRRGFRAEKRKQVISFTKNPLANSTLLGELFTVCTHQQVIELHYHTYAEPELIRSLNLFPYLLKEYNQRWFIFGAAEQDGKLLNFALDRINKVVPLPSHKFIDYDGDLNKRFEDIVGVTLYESLQIEHIVCWVSDTSKGYVNTKPIHESFTKFKGEKGSQLHEQYPQLQGGMFFSIDCIPNFELIRELCSFGENLVVLSPQSIRQEIKNRLIAHLKQYQD